MKEKKDKNDSSEAEKIEPNTVVKFYVYISFDLILSQKM